MKNTMKTVLSAAMCLIAAVLPAACGGGSGSHVAPGTSATPASGAQGALRNVTISINIPGHTTASKRNVAYVGIGTQSAQFDVTPSGGTPAPSVVANCTTTCQATLGVPFGMDTFTVQLFNAPNAGGMVLSTGTTTQMISTATANAVNLTFNGVPVSVEMSPATQFTDGTGAAVALTVNALDADGNTIVAPGVFTQAITLSTDNVHVTVSPTSFPGPASGPFTATYDGTPFGVTTGVNFLAAIGSGSAMISGSTMINAVGGGLLVTPSTLNLTIGGTDGTVTASESGFGGAFSITEDTCTGPGNATISPSSGPGPSQAFTVHALTSTIGPGCSFDISDGTTAFPVTVFVSP